MARIVIQAPGQEVSAGAAGQTDTVIGTSEPGEIVNVVRGAVVLDSSFNAGGDIIRLPGAATRYTTEIVGSRVLLIGPSDLSVSIPIGAPMLLEFHNGDTRWLSIAGNNVVIGNQIIASGDTLIDVRSLGAENSSGTIVGTVNSELLQGGDGDDTVNGQAGNDTLYGGPGKDILDGGAGRDTLDGGVGADRLTGGADADIFTFQHGQSAPTNVRGVLTYDRVTDFEDGIDFLKILDPGGNPVSGGIVRVVSGGTASSETTLVDTLELLSGGRYTNEADAIVFTVANAGVGVVVDSNNNNILDADDVFIWLETPNVVITAADFA